LTANLQQLTTQLARSTTTLNDLMARINRGEGTLGKLATDTLLYGDLHKALDAVTNLLNDLRERPGRYLTVKVF
jgi:phospholipid/cholesterol/gamma-HCH transport system substrate-binding protein